MSRNYAKISPRGEQRHRKNHSSSKPGYFVVLLLLIIGVTFYYVSSRGMFISTTRDTAASPSSSHPSTPTPAASPKPRFEFYTLLSKETVPVPHDKNKTTNNVTADATTSEAESVLESKKETEKNAEQNNQKAQSAQTTSQVAPETAPTGVPSIQIPSAVHKVSTASTSPKPLPSQQLKTPPPSTTTATSIVNSATSARYMLQVAALQRINDIDQLKAKLSFMGFSTSIEPFQSGGTTWYRIKVGPFLSQDAVKKAQRTLTTNRLGSLLITLPPASK